jgi:hypothetical protein
MDAERLKYLDNYRLICERRIKDLAPSHPLPVLPSHCGKPNPDIEELRTRLRLQPPLMDSGTQSVEVVKLRATV